MNAPLRVTNANEPETPTVTPARAPWLIAALGVGLAVLVVIALALYDSGQRLEREMEALRDQREKELQQQLQAQQTQVARMLTPAPSPTPACTEYKERIRVVQEEIRRGDYTLAGQLAKLPPPDQERSGCPDARRELAALAYTAALEGLLTPGLDGHTALLRWQEAEAQADAAGVPRTERLPAMSVAGRAYNASQWELARAAFLQAWQEGDVDRRAMSVYYATLRNWGVALAERGDEQERPWGLVLLRTADKIAEAYKLSQGEAHQDLVRLLGPDQNAWPPPDLSDPVLAAAGP